MGTELQAERESEYQYEWALKALKDKLEKAYEFMKQFTIGGKNLLKKFLEWIGEKVKDVGRGRWWINSQRR